MTRLTVILRPTPHLSTAHPTAHITLQSSIAHLAVIHSLAHSDLTTHHIHGYPHLMVQLTLQLYIAHLTFIPQLTSQYRPRLFMGNIKVVHGPPHRGKFAFFMGKSTVVYSDTPPFHALSELWSTSYIFSTRPVSQTGSPAVTTQYKVSKSTLQARLA
jgi:hypothetical protein